MYASGPLQNWHLRNPKFVDDLHGILKGLNRQSRVQSARGEIVEQFLVYQAAKKTNSIFLGEKVEIKKLVQFDRNLPLTI